VTQDFTDTLPVGGTKFYSFTVSTYGTVNVTLNSMSGAFVPATVQVSVGIGTPSGTSCSVTTPVTQAASTSVLVTATEQVGVYCVAITDVGNLFAPAVFDITIAHP
jgi:hypothetical protein